MIWMKLCTLQKNLYVIEDCAKLMAQDTKEKVLDRLRVGCWSFCQDKIMSTAGEGGIVTTNNKKLWEKCGHLKIMENHSMLFTKTEKTRFQIQLIWN